MKAKHKDIVNMFKKMGYQEVEILPKLERTVLMRDGQKVIVNGSVWARER